MTYNEEIVPTAPDAVNRHTYNELIKHWIENLYANLPQIRSGLDLSQLGKKSDKPCICIGGGPSLNRYGHLRQIAKAKWKHPILCCDKEIVPCLKREIFPYAVGTVDGHPAIAKYYSHKLVKKHSKDIAAVFNGYIHPNVVNSWLGPIYWCINILDDIATLKKKSVTYIMHLLTRGKSMINTLGNVGAFLINVAYVLECSPIILVGYDLSEQVKYKSQAAWFNAFVHMYEQQFDTETARQKAADLHQVEYNPDFNRYFLVNPYWKGYRDMLAEYIIQSGQLVVQCTGNGPLHTKAVDCPNFRAMTLGRALKKYA